MGVHSSASERWRSRPDTASARGRRLAEGPPGRRRAGDGSHPGRRAGLPERHRVPRRHHGAADQQERSAREGRDRRRGGRALSRLRPRQAQCDRPECLPEQRRNGRRARDPRQHRHAGRGELPVRRARKHLGRGLLRARGRQLRRDRGRERPDAGCRRLDLARLPRAGELVGGSGDNIVFTSGTYCFSTVNVSGGGLVTANATNGPVIIKINGVSSFGGGGVVNATALASNLEIISSYTGVKGGLTINGGRQAYAQVYAPHTEVVLGGGTDFYGSLVAGSISSTGGSKVH